MHRVVIGLLACCWSVMVLAEGAVQKTVEALHQEKAELKGQQVQIQGKVVKVNNAIMDRNFLHIQDGSGSEKDGTHDLTVTSDDTANIGDEITITGTVAVDHDFGSGYMYPLLVEKATIAKAAQ